MIGFLLALVTATATPASTSQCATVSPVTTSTNVAGLQADADCFTAAATSDKAAASVLTKAASSATAAAKYRLDRIKQLQALPPPPPPPPPTKTCPDGSVILATAVCPPPPPPPPVDCGNGVTVPAGQTCPPPPPPPPSPLGGWVLASSVTAIPTTDFDINTAKKVVGLPPTNAPDTVGAFRFICNPGQLLRDDPIVYPGQPGRSHLHQFYGNTTTNANSTYASQRATGDSTCGGTDGKGHAVNRSGYWMPAMLDGKGNARKVGYLTVYYKRHPNQSQECNPAFNLTDGCVPIPDSLRMIEGADMSKAPAPYMSATWECTTSNGSGKYATDANGRKLFDNLAQVRAICPNDGNYAITMGLSFPDCWDGVYIDSPDHRSHVSHGKSSSLFAGAIQCPVSAKTGKRMKLMPVFRLFASYPVLAGDDPSTWTLSSDAMDASLPAGWSLHADYFEGWDPIIKKEWTDHCLDELMPDGGKYTNPTTGVTAKSGLPTGMGPKSCQGGNLGDHFMLNNAPVPGVVPPNPIIPLTSIP